MAEHDKVLHFTVLYRAKPLQLTAREHSTLGQLGKEIVDLTGVAPHTLRLMLPKRAPLQPMSERHSTTLVCESGITEGLTMRMMGASSAEVAGVSHPSTRDRILGFSEEEQRARQRSGYLPGPSVLPKGNYIFCDFQTLELPGIELNPPPAMALKIMHNLASDRGITAIMNKHRWRVGIMTEMAPLGYVGISPKCILGFNKNRGQEISLRLRTDDLKGFRKYESIKKTLLHELAHMVHDEHDEKFHALDKQLNKEAIELDWTKSQGHVLSGVKLEEEEQAVDAGGVGSGKGYKLGGDVGQARSMDPRAAAAAAALRRLGNAAKVTPEPRRADSGAMTAGSLSVGVPSRSQEPDPDAAYSGHTGKGEPDPDEAMDTVDPSHLKTNLGIGFPAKNEALDFSVRSKEPDPDDASAGKDEPDPDEAVEIMLDTPLSRQEQDPDEVSGGHVSKHEPNPDEAAEMVLEAPVRSQEPDPDEVSSSRAGDYEPDPDEAMDIAPLVSARSEEPDPDEVYSDYVGKDEPDPDEAVDIVLDAPVRSQEPDPDAAAGPDVPVRSEEPDPDEMDIVPRANEPDPDELSGEEASAPVTLDLSGAAAFGGQSRRLEAEPDLNDPDGKRSEQPASGGCREMAGNGIKSWTGRCGQPDVVTPEKSR